MTNNKPDAADFSTHIASLKKRFRPGQAWWADYLFHFTEIHNAVSILKSEELLSRNEVLRQKINFVDSALSNVINMTNEKYKEYVRFYFRPKTPTLYLNEGIRPSLPVNAPHCAVPVYFLFSSKDILSMQSSKFSNGNLANDPELFETSDDFAKLPFNKIYHDGSIREFENRRDIVNCRHSEVLVPKRVSLEHLKQIECRSSAERDMLAYYLGPDWNLWGHITSIPQERSLFNLNWNFIYKVNLFSDYAEVFFHEAEDTNQRGPFRLQIIENDTMLYEKRDYYITSKPVRIHLSGVTSYTLTIKLDNYIAYKNNYTSWSDIPF